MTTSDDIYSLLQWCIGQELEAHVNAVKHHGFTKGLEYEAELRRTTTAPTEDGR